MHGVYHSPKCSEKTPGETLSFRNSRNYRNLEWISVDIFETIPGKFSVRASGKTLEGAPRGNCS